MERFVVGLGNPGLDGTVHNMGSAFIDELVRIYGRSPIAAAAAFSSALVSAEIQFRVLKPMSEMNVSGRVVFNALKKHVQVRGSVPMPFLLVVADDVDLSPGKARIRFAKSMRGHNGIKNIAKELGSNLFFVLWIGAGRPSCRNNNLSDYVLDKIPENQREAIDKGVRKGLLLFQKWLWCGEEV
ncbi:aminoacyl-tRNA hydrolase [Candidatus Similichlamydia epinepheli]|uniref:aminoacyl-tRNA hydrolase n=1 Tax=Candidatus Similichlamydia epinepheli TaxID=1903953 RepID=UPI000D36073D|nr:aminoacyl-tRNA hydrolase [Candidatus Similichlamydia epinepheli]